MKKSEKNFVWASAEFSKDIEKAGIAQKKLAELLGVKESTMSGYVKGTSKPKPSVYAHFREVFKSVGLNFDKYLVPVESKEAQAELAKRKKQQPKVEAVTINSVKILSEQDRISIAKSFGVLPDCIDADGYYTQWPVLERVGAGNWRTIPDTAATMEPNGYIKVPKTQSFDKNGFGLIVDGDSMEPLYPRGCWIAVSPQSPINVGDHVIVIDRENGQTICKRIKESKDIVTNNGTYYKSFILQSLNDKYESFEWHPQSDNDKVYKVVACYWTPEMISNSE